MEDKVEGLLSKEEVENSAEYRRLKRELDKEREKANRDRMKLEAEVVKLKGMADAGHFEVARTQAQMRRLTEKLAKETMKGT